MSTATAASSSCASLIPTARGVGTPRTTACSCRSRPRARLRRAPLPPARRGHRRGPRRVHGPDAPPARGPRSQPQLPGRLGHRCRGSGDHPLSEPEIDALVRAIVARPNICGYNAFHTSGGVILRPSSTVADSTLPPRRRLGVDRAGGHRHRLTRYPVHSVFEDFTWDRADTMSGAADDWAYEHLGVFCGPRSSGTPSRPPPGRSRARTSGTPDRPMPRRWPCCAGSTSTRPASTSTGTRSTTPSSVRSSSGAGAHPACGRTRRWTGWRPRSRRTPSSPSPRPWPRRASSSAMPPPSRWAADAWRVELGVANAGWLPTDVSTRARKEKLVLPLVVELVGDGVRVVDGPARRTLHQLEGRAAMRFTQWADGTPDRALATWVVEGRGRVDRRARRPPPARRHGAGDRDAGGVSLSASGRGVR